MTGAVLDTGALIALDRADRTTICDHRLDHTVVTSVPKDIRLLGPNLKIKKI